MVVSGGISGVNPLGSTNAETCFVASSPDNAEKSLNYTFSFDRTDESNMSIDLSDVFRPAARYLVLISNLEILSPKMISLSCHPRFVSLFLFQKKIN